MMEKIAKELLMIAKELKSWPDHKQKIELLYRITEHEMNVDSGDERPVKEFKKLMRLVKNGGRHGERLSDSDWHWIYDVVSRMEMGFGLV